ncbi:MAG TPA: hypothetical protein VNL70_08040 [Tepidisphaeraceae bacterium]|nr:hypothetical protein [Tepidisphaeraceae bacterium]
MLHNGIQFFGDSFEAEKITVRNVMATATVANGVYALDVTASGGDTSGAADPVRAAAGNIVAVSTANLGTILVITPKPIRPGEVGEAIVRGPAKVLVNGTTDIAKGDRLKASNGSAVLTKASSAAGSTDIGVACAREAFTTDGDGTIKVFFDGICFNKVINGATT